MPTGCCHRRGRNVARPAAAGPASRCRRRWRPARPGAAARPATCRAGWLAAGPGSWPARGWPPAHGRRRRASSCPPWPGGRRRGSGFRSAPDGCGCGGSAAPTAAPVPSAIPPTTAAWPGVRRGHHRAATARTPSPARAARCPAPATVAGIPRSAQPTTVLAGRRPPVRRPWSAVAGCRPRPAATAAPRRGSKASCVRSGSWRSAAECCGDGCRPRGSPGGRLPGRADPAPAPAARRGRPVAPAGRSARRPGPRLCRAGRSGRAHARPPAGPWTRHPRRQSRQSSWPAVPSSGPRGRPGPRQQQAARGNAGSAIRRHDRYACCGERLPRACSLLPPARVLGLDRLPHTLARGTR